MREGFVFSKAMVEVAVYTYTYDSGGNILIARTENSGHAFTDADGDWKDLLPTWDDFELAYDGVGNPVDYYNGIDQWAMEWPDHPLLYLGRRQAGQGICGG